MPPSPLQSSEMIGCSKFLMLNTRLCRAQMLTYRECKSWMIRLEIDYTKDELNKFIESLDRKSFDKLNKFFDTMPQLRHEIEVENPKTKVKSKIVLKGAQDFFVLPSLTTA